MMSVDLKTNKWISAKMKNKNKKHICPVNYICNFFIVHILMLYFWRIFHIDILRNASNLHIRATLVHTMHPVFMGTPGNKIVWMEGRQIQNWEGAGGQLPLGPNLGEKVSLVPWVFCAILFSSWLLFSPPVFLTKLGPKMPKKGIKKGTLSYNGELNCFHHPYWW
jgi:hypothetical protein